MNTSAIATDRYIQKLASDDRRVIMRYLDFSSPKRVRSILNRLLKLPEQQINLLLSQISDDFGDRHPNVSDRYMENFNIVKRYLPNGTRLSQQQKLLIGAYFTMEYSIESAALFNPSIVPHPDQSGLDDGCLRFLLSLRATGEGHLSSIVFRRGTLNRQCQIQFDDPPRYAYTVKPKMHKQHDKRLFYRQLREAGVEETLARAVVDQLPDVFTLADVRKATRKISPSRLRSRAVNKMISDIRWLAEANYELEFPPDCIPSEIVIFPATTRERRGMEDLRLVHFHDNGTTRYFGTYTAFDGRSIMPMLLETTDFSRFHVRTMAGRYTANKGMALFPRKVGGQYLMISRHDGESLYLLHSDSPYFWNEGQLLQQPVEDWELVQIGNCGSPIETDAGWLLLTHGVGPVRKYCIGAMLLDRDNPAKVLGRLRKPLLIPSDDEREGYVPNVVYSCGAMIHHDSLIIPYAMADSDTTFARVDLNSLILQLQADGP